MNDKDDKQNDPMPDTRTPGNRSEKILVVFSCINKFKKKICDLHRQFSLYSVL